MSTADDTIEFMAMRIAEEVYEQKNVYGALPEEDRQRFKRAAKAAVSELYAAAQFAKDEARRARALHVAVLKVQAKVPA